MVSPALQRGKSGSDRKKPESRRDGARTILCRNQLPLMVVFGISTITAGAKNYDDEWKIQGRFLNQTGLSPDFERGQFGLIGEMCEKLTS